MQNLDNLASNIIIKLYISKDKKYITKALTMGYL